MAWFPQSWNICHHLLEILVNTFPCLSISVNTWICNGVIFTILQHMPPFVQNTCQYFSMLVNNCQYLTIQWRDFHNSASYATICSKYFSVLVNTCPQRRDFHNSETYAQADRVHISISGHPVLVSCFGVSGSNWIKQTSSGFCVGGKNFIFPTTKESVAIYIYIYIYL